MGGKHDAETINKVVNEEVAKSAPVFDPEKVQELLEVKTDVPYVELDAFTGDPYSLLGSVIEVRKKNGAVPASLAGAPVEFSLLPIPGAKVKESSKLKSPTLRQSLIIDKGIAAKVGFLNYLQAELNANNVFSITVLDQATGQVDRQDPSWAQGVKDWLTQNAALLQDPEVCYLYAIIGFVQKEVIRKKYVKFDAGAKGGAYGLNVDGKLHTSTEEYSLDIRFGLVPAIIKRPTPAAKPRIAFDGKSWGKPTSREMELFSSLTSIRKKARPAARKARPIGKKAR
jgi:hypothetical protein